MSKYKNLLLFWFTLSAIWGVYRIFEFPEFFSEVIAKPNIWLGVTGLFFSFRLIPKEVLEDLKKNFLHTKPFIKVFIFPILFTFCYFFLTNFNLITWPTFSLGFLVLTATINFSTGIVEEIIYRGVLYVWLLQKTTEVKAFLLVQLLFLIGHLPILILNSDSLQGALSHAFFIVLMGSINTLIFRITKSLYSSSLSHGLWNTLVYYLLLSSGR